MVKSAVQVHEMKKSAVQVHDIALHHLHDLPNESANVVSQHNIIKSHCQCSAQD